MQRSYSTSPGRSDDVVAPRQVSEAAVLRDEVDAVGASGAGQAEVLQDRHDEEKQLHTRQRLADTRSFSCNQAQSSHLNTTIINIRSFPRRVKILFTCRKRNESRIFLEVAILVQKVLGVKGGGIRPLLFVFKHRVQQR